MADTKICVVGSSNIDLVSYVPRLPKKGETLHGSKFQIGFGGKGANQAVMAAKLGAEVTIITKLGDDIFGRDTYDNFKSLEIKTAGVSFTQLAFSGVASIAVNPQGDNSIIIVPGANDLLSVEDLENSRSQIENAAVLVCQLEVPLEISLAALQMAKAAGVRTILNPAPAQSQLPGELFVASDIFCPNETETELLTGLKVETDEDAVRAAHALLDKGVKTVILTLGKRGSLLVDLEQTALIPAPEVEAVDTTGAGDAFIGSLAYFLAGGFETKTAIQRANQIAAISVQNLGTQTSFPERDDLPEELFR